MAEDLGVLTPRRGRHAEPLAHERVVVGEVFHPIPIRGEAQPHDAQHENLPEVRDGVASGLLAGEDPGFEQGDNLGLARGLASTATGAPPGLAATRPGSGAAGESSRRG